MQAKLRLLIALAAGIAIGIAGLSAAKPDPHLTWHQWSHYVNVSHIPHCHYGLAHGAKAPQCGAPATKRKTAHHIGITRVFRSVFRVHRVFGWIRNWRYGGWTWGNKNSGGN